MFWLSWTLHFLSSSSLLPVSTSSSQARPPRTPSSSSRHSSFSFFHCFLFDFSFIPFLFTCAFTHLYLFYLITAALGIFFVFNFFFSATFPINHLCVYTYLASCQPAFTRIEIRNSFLLKNPSFFFFYMTAYM